MAGRVREKETAYVLEPARLTTVSRGMNLKLVNRFIYNWPAAAIVVVAFALWEWGIQQGFISRVSFAPPSAIFATFSKMLASGELLGHLGVSLYRVGAGFAVGVAVGTTAGMLTGWFSPVRRSLEPIFTALYGFPKIALLPVMILVLGTGDPMRITLIAIMAFFPMWINVHAGVRDLDPLLVRVALNFGASQRQVLSKVALPYVVPYLIAGLKYSIGLALHLIVIVEMVAAKQGIGYLIWFSGTTLDTPLLLMGILVLVVLTVAILGLFNYAERRVAPWRLEVAEQ